MARPTAGRLSCPRAESAEVWPGPSGERRGALPRAAEPGRAGTDPRAADPAERVAGAETRVASAAAVEALPPEQRAAARLRFWAGAQLSGHGWEQLRADLEALREQLVGFGVEEP